MPNAEYFAEKAARCRELISRAANREVAEQLRLWADEFEIMAEAFGVRPIGGTHPTRPSAGDPLRPCIDNADDRPKNPTGFTTPRMPETPT